MTVHARPPRLNVLCVSLTDRLNGAERVMLELAEGIDRTRFHPTVVVPAEGAVSRQAAAHGLETVVIPSRRWLPFDHDPAAGSYHWRRYTEEVPVAVAAMVDVIRERRIHVVYSASATILHGALAALVAGRAHVHHLQEILGDGNLGLVMPRQRPQYAYQLIGALASRVVCISDASEADAGETISPAQRRRVPLGFGAHVPTTPPIALPSQPGERVRLGIVGGVWRPKGTDIIASVITRVNAMLEGVHIYWLGPGDKQTTDRLTAASTINGVPHLHFLGYADSVWPFMQAIDFLVHPSRSECFPRVLMEAALAGRAVVATRCGGAAEIVVDGETGLLTDVDDVEALAGAIVRLATEPARARAMGAAARTRASAFTMDRFVSGMQNVLDEAYLAGPVVASPAARRMLATLLNVPAVVLPAARTARATMWGGSRC
jgi:glycosyltransferase involved in cell wall biosynthesis